jgi:hypothetical protein
MPAYHRYPSTIIARRPKRSDSAPPITDEVILTTCSPDQRSGIHTAATPRSLRRSRMNASLALPSENRVMTAIAL